MASRPGDRVVSHVTPRLDLIVDEACGLVLRPTGNVERHVITDVPQLIHDLKAGVAEAAARKKADA